MKNFLYKPFFFFAVAILFTWVMWFAAAYLSYQPNAETSSWFSVFEILGLFGPVTAAFLAIFTSGNTALKQNFAKRLFDLKLIRLSSLPLIVFIMPIALVISVLLSYLFFGQPLGQMKLVALAPVGMLPVPVMFFGAALLEEIGWKGYGIDSLRGERTFFAATLIYAALWASWHVPLFFINNYYHNTLLRMNPWLAFNFFASIFPAAFIINWLWYKNKGSILAAVLFHAAANCQGLLQMGQAAKCLETGVMVIVAAVIVIVDKKIFFQKFPAKIGHFDR